MAAVIVVSVAMSIMTPMIAFVIWSFSINSHSITIRSVVLITVAGLVLITVISIIWLIIVRIIAGLIARIIV